MDIFLEKHKSKESVETKKSLHVELNGDKKLLPENVIESSVDSYLLYNKERTNCNKIRLICTINPICTNVLFNPVSEIIKNEGGKDVISLNYTPIVSAEITDVLVKPSYFVWDNIEAIRDTQLSSNKYGFDYHCGIDIFNNHILRNLTYKSVRYPKEDEISDEDRENFNTINDYLRSYDGTIVTEDSQYASINPSIAPGTRKNEYTSSVTLHRSHSVGYYRVTSNISFDYPPPLGETLSISIYCSYNVTIDSETIPSYSSFTVDLVGDNETTYFTLPQKVLTYQGSLQGYEMNEGKGWFREGKHGREVIVDDIKVEPVRNEQGEQQKDAKGNALYRMTAVINGESISHEINQKQYDKFMAIDDYHRMKLFSHIFHEVDMKNIPGEHTGIGAKIGGALLAGLAVMGELGQMHHSGPSVFVEHHHDHDPRPHIYFKPGVDSPQDIASRAFDAGVNAGMHGVGLGR